MRDGCVDQAGGVPLWQRLTVGRNPRLTLIRAVVLGVACWVTFRHLILPVRIVGISMQPTLQDGSVNLVNRLPYFWREPTRGEIVGIRTTGTSVMYLKRIIALPGEQVEIRLGHVLVNREPLSEPYLTDAQPWVLEPRTLARDEYLVIGDNRTMPMELHWGGVIKRERIIGKAVWSGARK